MTTRNEAIESGMLKYCTGKLCTRGHESYRYTASGACVECVAGYAKDTAKRVREKQKQRRAGMIAVTCTAHADDVPLIHRYADALALARVVGV